MAVADARESEAVAAGAEYGCRYHSDYRELLKCPDVDLVVVATPTRLHSRMTLDAIDAGKHVLVEKPFASGSVEAREMFEAGRRAGVFVGAFHNRRYDACVQGIRAVLASGSLGPIVHTGIRLHSYTRRQDWQTLRSHGGGALSNWGAHILDWCIYLFGPQIEALQVQLVHALNPGDSEDGFYLLLKCPDGSLVSVEYFNCVARGLPRWQVIGQTGTAIYDKDKISVRRCDPACLTPISAHTGASDGTYGVKEDLGWVEEEFPAQYRDNSIFFYEELAKHLNQGDPAPVTETEVIRLLEITESLRASPVRELERFLGCSDAESETGDPPLPVFRKEMAPSTSLV